MARQQDEAGRVVRCSPGRSSERAARCQHLLDNFQTVTIDPETLKVKLDGLLPLISPSPDQDFYQRSSGNSW